MRTKELERSEFALKKISEFGELDKKTVNFIVGAPTMILTNGIWQTLAFLCSKGEDKHKKVLMTIKEWLSNEGIVNNEKNDLDFIKKFSQLDQKTYLKAQSEALAILSWLKRYARAFGE